MRGLILKRFDQDAIVLRKIKYLQNYDEWKNIQRDGALYHIIEAEAEAEAELARYIEYSLQELKWDTARNYSSVKHMARLVSKKLDRKHSAVGSIIVSHSDPEGNQRILNLGVANLDIDAVSNYDDGSIDTSLTNDMYLNALVPWTSSTKYGIVVGDTFTTKTGTVFTAAETKSIQEWTGKWSAIERNELLKNNFRASGGWNNYKYLSIPVVQGEVTMLYLGSSDNTASQSFIVDTLDIEAADNYYTEQFCKVILELPDGSKEEWAEVYHLTTCDSSSSNFEINILDDLTGTEIKFGDGMNGRIPPKDALIYLQYLKTSGAAGDVLEAFSFKNVIGWKASDTEQRPLVTVNGYKNLTINCQNVWPIIGGKDLETIEEFKLNAETAYSKNYKILHTYNELIDNINTISPIPLIKVKTKDFYGTETLDSVKLYKKYIGITGLSTSLSPLNNVESNLFETTVNYKLNQNILSNKYIKYLAPQIIELDSYINIELTTPVVSVETYEKDIQNHLLTQLGKTNTEPIDCYMQSELLKRTLQYKPDIGAITATTLMTFNYTSIQSVQIEGEDYVAFVFNSPKLEMDNFSHENQCANSARDGNKIIAIFNFNINSSTQTFVVTDTGVEDDNKKASVVSGLKIYTQNTRFEVQELLSEKHTFNKTDLISTNNLVFKENAVSTKYYLSFGQEEVVANFFIKKSVVANALGFGSINLPTNARLLTILESSLQNEGSTAMMSFEPADSTVKGDWNTTLYYSHIDVKVTNG